MHVVAVVLTAVLFVTAVDTIAPEGVVDDAAIFVVPIIVLILW